jgi:hypothetical protein
MRLSRAVIAVCLFLLGSGAAAAQESGKGGVTMGYPASIGVVWHVSERLAVRPEVSLSITESSTSGLGSSETDSWVLGTGVSILFYMRKGDNLSTYLAPRFTYTRNDISSEFTNAGGTGYSLAGLFGAQYSLGRRFSVFGEAGLGFATQRSTSVTSLTEFTTRAHTLNTRTGAGVIFYF